MAHYCSTCGEEFDPVEYREVPAGEEEFCSPECEELFDLGERMSYQVE